MANLNDKSTWHQFAGGAFFGSADYHTILRLTVGIGPHSTKTFADITQDDIQALVARKREVIDWLNDKGPSGGNYILNNANKPGAGPNSLYDEIARNSIGTWHGWTEGTDTPEEYEARRGNFGGTDYLHALASGHTKAQVVTWLESNYDKLGAPHAPIAKGGSNTGLYTQLVGEEASTDFGKPKPDVVPGAGGSKYGNIDYHTQLKVIWDTHKDPSLLHEYRAQTLDFLATSSEVADHNKPGVAGGLHDQILTHIRQQDFGKADFDVNAPQWHSEQIKITPWWGDRSTPEAAETAEKKFTEADYLAARAGGHNDYDVYKYLRANTSQYRFNDETRKVYDTVRQGLMERSPMYVFEDDSAERQENWRTVLENPIWQEVGEYLSRNAGTGGIPRDYHDHDWRNHKDYDIIEAYIRDNYKPEGWEDMDTADRIANFRTDEQLTELIGLEPGVGPDAEGAYWEQYGPSGPPDLDQGDGLNKSDLTWIQKMVAQAGLESLDPSEWKPRMEDLENRFLKEMFIGEPGTKYTTGADPKWRDAPDAWGLDIMRLDEEGEALEFTEANIKSDEWYETLTKGDIDWAFYQKSSTYQEAKKALGLKGTFTEGSLGVAGIREANVWVHGQNVVMPGNDEILKSWIQYEKKPLPDKYVATDLNITGYTPEDKKGLATVKDAPAAPTINLPDVKLKRPSNLDSKLGTLVGE